MRSCDPEWNGLRTARRVAHLILGLLCALALPACVGGPGGAPSVGRLAPPPAGLPPAGLGAADALLGGGGFSADDPALDWGDGMLRLSGPDGYARIDLPLFDEPRGRHWGWLTQGRVYDQIARRTLPDRSDAAVMVSGARALMVLDEAAGGWLRIRYGDPGDRGRGLAWTHPDLASGARASFLSWARALDGAQGLVYRNAAVAHNLRAGPGSDAAIIARLEGENFDMAALEIRGDWMRVRVSAPPACAGTVAEDLLLGGASPRVETGWIAWRSDDRGPWVASAAGPRCAGGV